MHAIYFATFSLKYVYTSTLWWLVSDVPKTFLANPNYDASYPI